MAKCRKQKLHLKRINKIDKRANNLAIALRGTLIQRINKNKGNSNLILEDEQLSVNNVEPFHLDKILKLLRERNWDHINERMLGVMIFLLFKLNGISRKKITETLNQIEGISYLRHNNKRSNW